MGILVQPPATGWGRIDAPGRPESVHEPKSLKRCLRPSLLIPETLPPLRSQLMEPKVAPPLPIGQPLWQWFKTRGTVPQLRYCIGGHEAEADDKAIPLFVHIPRPMID